MEDDPQQPYRATRLWNEVIVAFRTGMPLKRHRHLIKHYKDCFTASDCISWLNCYLKNNPNFGPHVTRQQTMQLLQKFLKCNVIESVTCKNGKTEFNDDSHLYKFVEYSPPKSVKKSPLQALLRMPMSSRTNLASMTNPMKGKMPKSKLVERAYKKGADVWSSTGVYPECHFVEKQLSVDEVENIWRSVTLNRLEQLILPLKPDDLIDLNAITGRTIMHNANKISRTGVVTLVDKADDIPHWVISAMKCLANWPDASGTGSCLPKYPGFEKDVFKVIKNHFLNPQVALIPRDVQKFIISSFFRTTYPKRWTELQENFWKTMDEQNTEDFSNDHKTSTPLCKSAMSLNNSCSDVLNIQSMAGRILLNDSKAMWQNPLSMCYETEFTTQSPVTRVIRNYSKLSSDRGSALSLAESIGSMMSLASTMSACSSATKACSSSGFFSNSNVVDFDHSDSPEQSFSSRHDDSLLEKTVVSMPENFSKYSKISSRNIHSISLCNASSDSDCETSESLYVSCELNNDYSPSSEHAKDGGHLASNTSSPHPDTFCCTRSSSIVPFLNETSVSGRIQSCLTRDSPNDAEISNGEAISNRSKNTTSQLPYDAEEQSKPPEDMEIPCTEDFKEVMQVVLLLMPTPQRRHLHLLLRMMNKIARNDKLVLDSSMGNKEYLLDTFLPAVMSCGHLDHQRDTVKQIFCLMVNECESFLRPPSAVTDEALNRISELQRRRIKYCVDDLCNLTYCEMISQQQYEHQKVSLSHQALSELLENIVQDDRLSEKEKRRRFKQFKESHPDVYRRRFPSTADVDNVFMKPKKLLLPKFLGMRM